MATTTNWLTGLVTPYVSTQTKAAAQTDSGSIVISWTGTTAGGAGTDTTLYSVPAGRTLRVQSVLAFNNTGVNLWIGLYDSTTAVADADLKGQFPCLDTASTPVPSNLSSPIDFTKGIRLKGTLMANNNSYYVTIVGELL